MERGPWTSPGPSSARVKEDAASRFPAFSPAHVPEASHLIQCPLPRMPSLPNCSPFWAKRLLPPLYSSHLSEFFRKPTHSTRVYALPGLGLCLSAI